MNGIWKKSVSMFRPFGFLRNFRTSCIRREEVQAQDLVQKRKPTDFQKKMLIWARVYKSESEIPERVSATKLKKAHDVCRVYGMGTLIAIGAAMSLAVVIYSHYLRNTGQDGVTMRHEMQMAKWKEEAAKEEAEKAEKAEEAAPSADAKKK